MKPNRCKHRFKLGGDNRFIGEIRPMAVCMLALAALLLGPDVWSQQTLPQPPSIGAAAASTSDPTGYLIGAVRVILTAAFVVLALFAIGSFGGGLIAELNTARQRGEWGKFGIYIAGGMLVLLIVLFAGWWGGTIINTYLN